MSIKVKNWALAMSVVCAQILATALPVQAQVVSNTWMSTTTSFVDTCTGELVNFSIDVHSVTRLMWEDPDGTRHFTANTNFHGEGVGAASGKKYRYMGNSSREFSLGPSCTGGGTAETFTRAISQGKSDNRYLKTESQFVASPTGPGGSCILVLGGFSIVSFECRG
jgi:hypothetical protein